MEIRQYMYNVTAIVKDKTKPVWFKGDEIILEANSITFETSSLQGLFENIIKAEQYSEIKINLVS